jgi:hypothetical protein
MGGARRRCPAGRPHQGAVVTRQGELRVLRNVRTGALLEIGPFGGEYGWVLYTGRVGDSTVAQSFIWLDLPGQDDAERAAFRAIELMGGSPDEWTEVQS